tara:strand:+ start:373 stop:1596 length:1224 start_codon:yes stop_codon:yes gene_type:complete
VKRPALIVAITLLATFPAQARLGDSRLDLTQRYGQPISEQPDQLFGSHLFTFHHEGWTIQAYLLNGRCQAISHTNSGSALSTYEQIENLKAQNSQGQAWYQAGQKMASATNNWAVISQIHYPRADHQAYLLRMKNGVFFKSAHWKQLEQKLMPSPSARPSAASPTGQTSKTPSRTTAPSANTSGPGSAFFLVILLTPMVIGAITVIGREIRRSPRVKGWIGEKSTDWFVLKLLPSKEYRIFNNVFLPRPDKAGSTEIDHIVLSPYGIFVIETKNLGGWIHGSENDENWTLTFPGKKHAIQNPLRQNHLHVQALKSFLALPDSTFHSIINLCGRATFKTEKPRNVVDTLFLSRTIKSYQTVILNPEALERATHRLEAWIPSREMKRLKRGHIPFLRSHHGGGVVATRS